MFSVTLQSSKNISTFSTMKRKSYQHGLDVQCDQILHGNRRINQKRRNRSTGL